MSCQKVGDHWIMECDGVELFRERKELLSNENDDGCFGELAISRKNVYFPIEYARDLMNVCIEIAVSMMLRMCWYTHEVMRSILFSWKSPIEEKGNC